MKVYVEPRPGKGKTRYRLRWVDRDGVRRSKPAGTDRRNAERQALELEGKLAGGSVGEALKITWQAFVDDHVAKLPGTRNATEARRTLEEFGKHCTLRKPTDATYTIVERYVAYLRGKNSIATVNKKLRYVRAALNRAIDRGYAVNNPLTGSRGLFTKEPKPEPKIATPADEEALLTAAEDRDGAIMKGFVAVALATGGRRGELVSLTWDRVTLDGDNPSVLFTETKGKQDRRVPLNQDTVDTLRLLKAQTLKDGGPFIQLRDNLGRRWAKVRKAAKVDLSPHDLRRTFVTRLMQRGVPAATVQRLAGHADLSTTIRYYTKVDAQDLREGISRLLA